MSLKLATNKRVLAGIAGVIAASYVGQMIVRERFFGPMAYTASSDSYQKTLEDYMEKINADPITRRAERKRAGGH
jgi:hypothetical protein